MKKRKKKRKKKERKKREKGEMNILNHPRHILVIIATTAAELLLIKGCLALQHGHPRLHSLGSERILVHLIYGRKAG